MSRIPRQFLELVHDALLKSFWRKSALRHYLRASGVSEAALSKLDPGATKRDWLDELIPRLEAARKGPALIAQMARSLAEQTAFPDLENWDDSPEKIREAELAVMALGQYIARKEDERESEAEREAICNRAAESRARAARSQTDLAGLRERLDGLSTCMGTPGAGYEFQAWFFDLLDSFEVENRRPSFAAGRLVDGSLAIDGQTYLVDLRFTGPPAEAAVIESFRDRVKSEPADILGIMLSMSGYSALAVDRAALAQGRLLLLDFTHVYMVLQGVEAFPNVVRRLRRYSSRTGSPYLVATNFGSAT